MSALRITPDQIRAIHAIRTRTRLDEPSYRGMLAAYGVETSKALSRDDADRLLARMRDIPGAEARGPSARASGPYAKKLRAMWLALYNLGAVGDRGDTALHAFVEGQTGIAHTRFLTAAPDAQKVIEALKAMLTREGVRWPGAVLPRQALLAAMKRAVLKAQWQRLIALGAVRPFGDPEACDGLADYASQKLRGGARRLGSIEDPGLTLDDLDTVARFLGAWIRRAKTVGARTGGADAR